jgi:hypothetical protein
VAVLRKLPAGNDILLEPEHLIGRDPKCTLVIDEAYVSARHAMLRWTGGQWELRDLGSRNGTFVDGVRLIPGESRRIARGANLDFGGQGKPWEVSDESPPLAMAVPLGGGPHVLLEGELVSLPSPDDPRVTIYKGPRGWMIEQPDSVVPIVNAQTFEVDGRAWRFCCPENVQVTDVPSWPRRDMRVRTLSLTFSVSSDEEHVQLRVEAGERAFDLGTRNHHYLLLTLARQRKSDEAAGEVEPRCGWVYQDDIMRHPDMSPQQLNLDVFRIRQQFAALGVEDAACIIERRPRAKQIRIANCRLSIVRL